MRGWAVDKFIKVYPGVEWSRVKSMLEDYVTTDEYLNRERVGSGSTCLYSYRDGKAYAVYNAGKTIIVRRSYSTKEDYDNGRISDKPRHGPVREISQYADAGTKNSNGVHK